MIDDNEQPAEFGFFVEFDVVDAQRFEMLVVVFKALVAAKESDNWRDDNYWLQFFDTGARNHFWWPTPEEVEDWKRRWFSTPLPQRWTDPSLKTPWIFGSMIDAFKNSESDLIDCYLIGPTRGRLEFEPIAHPYGGTECMVTLVEAFGCHVTSVSE